MGGRPGKARIALFLCPRCGEKKLRWLNINAGQLREAFWVCADCVTPEEYKHLVER